MPSNYEDVRAFHEKYDVPIGQLPHTLSPERYQHRIKFMQEELDEYKDAVATGDIASQFDALIDLVYVALGTAIWQGFPWQAGWDEVQRANMQKVMVENVTLSRRNDPFDVVKPVGWLPPDLATVLLRAAAHAKFNAVLQSCPDEPPQDNVRDAEPHDPYARKEFRR